MKKVEKIILLVLVATICMASSVYAALSCNITLEAEKKELSKNEEFVVDVKISNIQSDRGIISLGATLEYDKDSLELVKMEGQNNWETPQAGFSYNENNGKIVITRNGFVKDTENILKLTFKMKEGAKESSTITLKDITVADGNEPANVNSASVSVSLKKDNSGGNVEAPIQTPDDGNSEAPVVTPTPDANKDNNTSIQTPTQNNSNSNSNNTVSTGKLPKTGDTNYILIIGIGMGIILATGFFIKAKSIK